MAVKIKNLKLAGALVGVGVSLTRPTITRVKVQRNGHYHDEIALFFADQDISGKYNTKLLVQAWEEPSKFIGKEGLPGLMPILRACADNKEKISDSIRALLAEPDIDDAIRQIWEAAYSIPCYVMNKVGPCYVLVSENASRKTIEECTSLALTGKLPPSNEHPNS